METKKEGVWEQFISTYTSNATIQTYRTATKTFFKYIYSEKAQLEESADRYFAEGRNYETDVKGYFAFIKDRPPKTVQAYMSILRTFLEENNVELPRVLWKRLARRKRGSRAITEDIVPSNAQLRQILSHMRIKGKSLYLTLSSSGMRIGEALQLRLDDVDLDASPTQIHIRAEYTKSGNRRIAFISDEATEALREWLKVREAWLKQAVAKSQPRPHYKKEFKGKSLDDKRIFPFESNTAYAIWHNALDKTKLNAMDETTKRRKIHPHVLRKFFRTRLGTIIPIDIVEALMGHEGYLTEVYRRYTPEMLGEKYKEGKAALDIFGAVGVGQEFTKLKQEHAGFEAVVNRLTLENVALNERLRKGEMRRRKMQKELDKLKEGDADIDKIVEVLRTMINAPLGYDEGTFDKALDRAEKTLKELVKRRLKK